MIATLTVTGRIEGDAMRTMPTVMLVAVLAVGTGGQGGCETSGAHPIPSCSVDTRGIRPDDGAVVVDYVTASCDRPPLRHKFEAWLEYSTSRRGGYTMPRFPAGPSWIIPDQEGVTLRVELPCRPGWYRTAWRTTGVGPASAEAHEGVEFDLRDGDFNPTDIRAEDCRGH